MKVILAGYPKTGTKSLRDAFLELGLSNYDFPENYLFLGDQWTKILTEGGTTEDFRRMFGDVDTITDLPGSYFWQEIHEAFPDSKIILTMRRNEDEWWKSFERQMATGDRLIHRILPLLSPSYYRFNAFLKKLSFVVFGTFGSNPVIGKNKINELVLKGKYRRHNAHVMHSAPKNKLLVYNLDDGWEPLCKFLDCPVPNKPFPHSNKKGSITEEWMTTHPLFLQMQREMKITCSVIALVPLAIYLFYRNRSFKPQYYLEKINFFSD